MVVRRSALQRSGDKNVSQTPLKPICVQYGFRFFDREKSKSVASTVKRQRGLQRGKPGSPLPCFALGPPAGRKARWGKEEWRSVGGLPKRKRGRPDMERSPRRRAGAKGRPLRRAVLTMPLQKAPRRRQARKIVIKEGGTYGKEKRTGEGPGRPVPG